MNLHNIEEPYVKANGNVTPSLWDRLAIATNDVSPWKRLPKSECIEADPAATGVFLSHNGYPYIKMQRRVGDFYNLPPSENPDTATVLVRLNRLVLMLEHGWLNPGELALHRCNNPLCVRRSHLYIGDNFDNSQDAKAAGTTKLAAADFEWEWILLPHGKRKFLSRQPNIHPLTGVIYPSKYESFMSKIEGGEAGIFGDECANWTACMSNNNHPNPIPYFCVTPYKPGRGTENHSAVRVLIEHYTGLDFGDGHLHRLCGNNRCMTMSHIYPGHYGSMAIH